MGSCRVWSVYLTTRLLSRLSPKRLTSIMHILSPGTDIYMKYIYWNPSCKYSLFSVQYQTEIKMKPSCPNFASPSGFVYLVSGILYIFVLWPRLTNIGVLGASDEDSV